MRFRARGENAMHKFKRGDVVCYTTKRCEGMETWSFLNGRMGVVTGLSEEDYDPEVQWITKCATEDYGTVLGYDPDLLELVAHIDLPPEAGEGEKHDDED